MNGYETRWDGLLGEYGMTNATKVNIAAVAKKQSVLVVDDTQENIDVLKGTLKGHYIVRVATNGRVALKVAFSINPPDLILLDVVMPEMDGYEVCRVLKADPRTQHIPVIFVSGRTEVTDESYGFSLGAADYLRKPVNAPIVLARVKTHLALYDRSRFLEGLVQELVQKQVSQFLKEAKELENTRMEIIHSLGRAAEFRDNETGLHVVRLGLFVEVLATKIGLPDDEIYRMRYASIMHDVGKIGIPDSILTKQGPLTPEEFEIIKTHPTIGAKIIGEHSYPLLRMAKEIALTHHEKWNGGGYPRGLRGTDIPLSGRITAIADIFDALTSVRPYKRAWSIEEALQYLANQSGIALDPDLVPLFLAADPQLRAIKQQFDDLASAKDR